MDPWVGGLVAAGIDARGFTHGRFKNYMCDGWLEGT